MITIELTLKATLLALSVQRKDTNEAEALYQQILKAMNDSHPQVLELTCDRQTDKKIGVLSSEISAVQISTKDAAAAGKAPGFWAELS